MTVKAIIQIAGIAIGIWEVLESRLSHIPKPITTKENFVEYLQDQWCDDVFTVFDVCPNDWTIQKTSAILTSLVAERKLLRFEQNNQKYYYLYK